MSTRRGFLKQLGIGAVAASLVTSPIWGAIQEFGIEEAAANPAVKLVLERLPMLEPSEREAIVRFVFAEVKNGNWDKVESFHFFGGTEELSKVNWKGND